MARIPFNVTARTARLIGRENVANATGAITELVKNSYDADASICIIYIDNRFSSIPNTISADDHSLLNRKHEKYGLFEDSYSFNTKTGKYHLLENIVIDNTNNRIDLLNFFTSHCRILIMDNGEGMNRATIVNHWMTIGTSNKQDDFMSTDGRIKTGAKGIGRFALDRLGQNCTMLTKMIDQNTQIWKVDWGLFDDNKTALINDITAELDESEAFDIVKYIKILPDADKLENFFTNKGTILDISGLRDNWLDKDIKSLYSSLELLIPPREIPFRLFLFSTLEKEAYGEILHTLCDDFDYKISAHISGEIINFKIFRNEYEIEKFPEEFYNLIKSDSDLDIYSKNHFGKNVTYTKKMWELLPGLEEQSKKDLITKIGNFDFTMYFAKLQTTQADILKYKYKDFNAHVRKKWMESFGGIQLFRDNFRVRPYGEIDSTAWDWLGLGLRQAVDPAAVKRFRRYRVRPNNVYGVINISRLTNISFEDKSSREGIQENKYFDFFKNLIVAIIEEFENDRSYIASILDKIASKSNAESHNSRRAKTVAKIVRKKYSNKESMTKEEQATYQLAVEVESQSETIEEMREIQKLLKAFASNGIMIAAFAHELHGIHGNLINRMADIRDHILPFLPENVAASLPEYENPYTMIEDSKKDDLKLKQWLSYTLGTIRKDKRRREKINVIDYFTNFKNNWEPSLVYRGVNLRLTYTNEEINLRFFEIDLDSIFNNLLVNTFDVFRIKGWTNRNIEIALSQNQDNVEIIYKDSGPGLSKDITDPYKIFDALFTTKKDPDTGKDIGTGLGMWLVKSITEDNDGKVTLIETEHYFAIQISFPIKFKRRG